MQSQEIRVGRWAKTPKANLSYSVDTNQVWSKTNFYVKQWQENPDFSLGSFYSPTIHYLCVKIFWDLFICFFVFKIFSNSGDKGWVWRGNLSNISFKEGGEEEEEGTKRAHQKSLYCKFPNWIWANCEIWANYWSWANCWRNEKLNNWIWANCWRDEKELIEETVPVSSLLRNIIHRHCHQLLCVCMTMWQCWLQIHGKWGRGKRG